MMNIRRLLILSFVAMLISSGPAWATSTVFNLDPEESWLTLSGAFCSCDEIVVIEAQELGSLIAYYSGQINVDLTADSITFQDAQAEAIVQGNYRPKNDGTFGKDPANYGGELDFGLVGNVQFALRNLIASLSSNVLSLDAGLHFPVNTLQTTLTQGEMDYRGTLLVHGPVGPDEMDLTGVSATNQSGETGELFSESNSQVIRVPIDITLVVQVPVGEDTFSAVSDESETKSLTLHLEGQLQGTNNIVPEPATGLFILFAAYPLLNRRNHKNLG